MAFCKGPLSVSVHQPAPRFTLQRNLYRDVYRIIRRILCRCRFLCRIIYSFLSCRNMCSILRSSCTGICNWDSIDCDDFRSFVSIDEQISHLVDDDNGTAFFILLVHAMIRSRAYHSYSLEKRFEFVVPISAGLLRPIKGFVRKTHFVFSSGNGE